MAKDSRIEVYTFPPRGEITSWKVAVYVYDGPELHVFRASFATPKEASAAVKFLGDTIQANEGPLRALPENPYWPI